MATQKDSKTTGNAKIDLFVDLTDKGIKFYEAIDLVNKTYPMDKEKLQKFMSAAVEL